MSAALSAATEILLSDLSACEPASALSADHMEPGRWLVMPYATSAFRGSMIFVGAENDAPPVRLAVPKAATGWYRIYIGTHHADVPDLISAAQSTSMDAAYMLRLKLPHDPCYHVILPERYLARKEGHWPDHAFGHADLVEVFWRSAELDGGYIEFSPAHPESSYRQTAACVAYVRLVPMSDAEIAECRRNESDGPHQRLIGVYDGMLFGHYPTTPAEFAEFVEPMRGSDFRAIAWSTSRADTVQYASRQFQIMDAAPLRGIKPYHNAHDMRRAIDAGHDPLAVMSRICREMGVELLVSMRLSSQHLPPHRTFCPEPVLWNDPSNRVIGPDGLPTGQLSLASPAVRERLTAVLREQVSDYDVSGIHLMFNRCYPFVLFETHVRREFTDRHGVDPTTLDPRDPRWISHKSQYITAFIRGVRAMLDDAGLVKGRRLKLALHVMSCPRHNLFYGLDLPPMIRAGWIDYLLPHPTFSPEIAALENGCGDGPDNVGHQSVTPARVMEWQRIAKGTGCGVYPDVFPRRQPADALRRQAINYYEAGTDGLSFHDVYSRIHRKSEWAMIARLGHIDELPHWEERSQDYFRKQKLKSLMGLSMDQRFNPGLNG